MLKLEIQNINLSSINWLAALPKSERIGLPRLRFTRGEDTINENVLQ